MIVSLSCMSYSISLYILSISPLKYTASHCFLCLATNRSRTRFSVCLFFILDERPLVQALGDVAFFLSLWFSLPLLAPSFPHADTPCTYSSYTQLGGFCAGALELGVYA